MIARLSGEIAQKNTDALIVDVNGVGYRVLAPMSTFYKIGEVGDDVVLHIHTHVREDAIWLYGFFTTEELKMFHLLNGVNGIGPKLALTILSGLEVPSLAAAITQGAKTELVKLPGLGKKTAERIILELKEKVADLAVGAPTDIAPPMSFNADDNDVLSALTNLGYSAKEAQRSLSDVKRKQPDLKDVEGILRETLKSLSKAK